MSTARINRSSGWRIPPRSQVIPSWPGLSSISNASGNQPSRSNGARKPPASLTSVPEQWYLVRAEGGAENGGNHCNRAVHFRACTTKQHSRREEGDSDGT